VIRLSSLSSAPVSFDVVLEDLRTATSARAAISGLINFVAARWRCGVVLSVDDDVLHELYILLYEQKLDREALVTVRGHSQFTAVTAHEDSVSLQLKEVHTEDRFDDEVDLVVLATGFRDLGPLPQQERYPALLDGVIDRFRFDENGYLAVNLDYSLEPVDPATPPLFLNGLCESTHGIGDAGSFSLLSLRAATIHDALQKRHPALTPTPAAS